MPSLAEAVSAAAAAATPDAAKPINDSPAVEVEVGREADAAATDAMAPAERPAIPAEGCPRTMLTPLEARWDAILASVYALDVGRRTRSC